MSSTKAIDHQTDVHSRITVRPLSRIARDMRESPTCDGPNRSINQFETDNENIPKKANLNISSTPPPITGESDSDSHQLDKISFSTSYLGASEQQGRTNQRDRPQRKQPHPHPLSPSTPHLLLHTIPPDPYARTST